MSSTMSSTMRRSLCCALITGVCWCSQTLAAATLEGTFTFEKAAPAGLAVWVPGVTKEHPAAAVLNQIDKQFVPVVLFARPGSVVTLRNSDQLQHNAFVTDKAAGVALDTGLNQPGADQSMNVSWPAGTAVRVGCKIHPQMQAWIIAIDSDAWVMPVAQAVGTPIPFTLPELPAACPQVKVWTSRSGVVTLDLPATGAATGELVFAGKVIGTVAVHLSP